MKQYKEIEITIKVKVPTEAKYIAVDSNGTINAFDLEPILYEPCYSPEDNFWCVRHPSMFLERVVPSNFRETLIKID